MKVYIFGAGASLGSQGPDLLPQLQAPLINSLFDRQYNTHAATVGVSQNRINELKDAIGEESIEEWLTAEWTKLGEPHGKETLARGRKLFGDLAVYLWWTMVNVSTTYNEDNGYHLFLQKLAELDDKEEKAFVNFNYDLLLDKAFGNVYGYDLSGTIENYTNHNYLKPHGSVNWFVDRRHGIDKPIQQLDRGANQLEILISKIASEMFRGDVIDKRLKIIHPSNVNLYNLTNFFANVYTNGEYGFPLVLLPLSTKMDDLIDGFMDRMRAEFNRIFSFATEIYVIGYRANDALFTEMISHVHKGTKLHVVGRETSQQILASILQTNPKLVAGTVYDSGFADFIRTMG